MRWRYDIGVGSDGWWRPSFMCGLATSVSASTNQGLVG
jgi:hypothetical protein